MYIDIDIDMHICRVFPTWRDGEGPLPPAKSLLIPPTWNYPPSRLPLPPKINCPPPQLNNNFHGITQ